MIRCSICGGEHSADSHSVVAMSKDRDNVRRPAPAPAAPTAAGYTCFTYTAHGCTFTTTCALDHLERAARALKEAAELLAVKHGSENL